MKMLLTPVGSAGDVFPFLGIGRELQRRGHEVSIVTNSYFEEITRKVGLDFISTSSKEDFEESIADPNLWHPRKAIDTIARLIEPLHKRVYDKLVEHYVPGETIIVAHCLAFGARVFQEKPGAPVVMMHTAPAILRSVHQMPTLLGTINFDGFPHFFKRWFWKFADCLIDPKVAPGINRLRAGIGLGPVKSVYGAYMHSPLLTIGMFPDWFAAPQPDWPEFVKLTGFPLYDTRGSSDVPDEMDRFLQSGDLPIVFTPGSAMAHGKHFFEAAIGAAQMLNRRAMLLTRFPEQIPDVLPDSVRHFEFAPLSAILHRCAALVHHGGIGTTAAALAAGIPQIIMPLSHDQPDNAARIVRLGVGGRIFPKKFKAPTVAQELKRLLTSDEVRTNCRSVADRIAKQDSIGEMCDQIEAVSPMPVESQS